MVGILTGLGTKLVDTVLGRGLNAVIDKYLPPSMSEAEKTKYELEMLQFKVQAEKEMEQLLASEEESFRNSVNTYEAPDRLSVWMLNYRASVRPTITYLAFALLVYIIGFGANVHWERMEEIPAQIWAMFLVIFGFWFGGRMLSDVRNGKNS